MHHKEVLLAVDTAKIILAAYPEAHLVVAGLKGQPAEAEMRAALEAGAAVVMFPSDDAAPASALAGPVDVVVIDGLARGRHARSDAPFPRGARCFLGTGPGGLPGRRRCGGPAATRPAARLAQEVCNLVL